MYPIEPIKIRYTVPLEELIAELERDPEFKAEMNEARKTLQEIRAVEMSMEELKSKYDLDSTDTQR